MSNSRNDIFNWVEQGRLCAEALPTALRLAGVTPGPKDWRRFLDLFSLWIGAIFIAAGVIFFFAYNWQMMARFAKFGLIEVLIVAVLGLCWYIGLDRISGKAALLVATLFIGALLALVGQTYQTGADPWELFAMWALVTLPWVALARFGALWLFWIGLLNLAVSLYYQTFGGLFGAILSTEQLVWTLFALNTTAFLVWEFAARLELRWLQERWPIWVLASASCGLITILSIWAILDFQSTRAITLLLYVVWMVLAHTMYRYKLRDVFILACCALSVIIAVTTFLSKHILDIDNAGGFLFIGLAVIGMSAVAGVWLKAIAAEDQ